MEINRADGRRPLHPRDQNPRWRVEVEKPFRQIITNSHADARRIFTALCAAYPLRAYPDARVQILNPDGSLDSVRFAGGEL